MGEKKIMLGNAAIARGAYEAGVKVSSLSLLPVWNPVHSVMNTYPDHQQHIRVLQVQRSVRIL